MWSGCIIEGFGFIKSLWRHNPSLGSFQYLLLFYAAFSSCRVSRSWITVCYWGSTTWTRPVGIVVGANRGTAAGQKEQWPQISAGHKLREVCTAQQWNPFKERLEERVLWIQKTSELYPQWGFSVVCDLDKTLTCSRVVSVSLFYQHGWYSSS